MVNAGFHTVAVAPMMELTPLRRRRGKRGLTDIEMLFRCFIRFIKSVKWDKENVYSAERHALIAFTFKRVLTVELLN